MSYLSHDFYDFLLDLDLEVMTLQLRINLHTYTRILALHVMSHCLMAVILRTILRTDRISDIFFLSTLFLFSYNGSRHFSTAPGILESFPRSSEADLVACHGSNTLVRHFVVVVFFL